MDKEIEEQILGIKRQELKVLNREVRKSAVVLRAKLYPEITNKELRKYALRSYDKGWDFNLSEGFYLDLVGKPCTYCGLQGKIGVDRIDTKVGYIESNCQPCCGVCNMMKFTHSERDFLSKVEQIYLNRIAIIEQKA